MTRPASNHPTPAALTDAPRPPNAADEVGQRGGVRAYSETQRAAPTTAGELSLESPKETLEVRTRFLVQPSCSFTVGGSGCGRHHCSFAMAGERPHDPPARCLPGGSSYSPPGAANGHVPTWQTGNETSHSCDGGTSHTRGPASLTQRLLHAASGPSLGSGLVGAATFFGGA